MAIKMYTNNNVIIIFAAHWCGRLDWLL